MEEVGELLLGEWDPRPRSGLCVTMLTTWSEESGDLLRKFVNKNKIETNFPTS